jgi:hypothetical protein
MPFFTCIGRVSARRGGGGYHGGGSSPEVDDDDTSTVVWIVVGSCKLYLHIFAVPSDTDKSLGLGVLVLICLPLACHSKNKTTKTAVNTNFNQPGSSGWRIRPEDKVFVVKNGSNTMTPTLAANTLAQTPKTENKTTPTKLTVNAAASLLWMPAAQNRASPISRSNPTIPTSEPTMSVNPLPMVPATGGNTGKSEGFRASNTTASKSTTTAAATAPPLYDDSIEVVTITVYAYDMYSTASGGYIVHPPRTPPKGYTSPGQSRDTNPAPKLEVSPIAPSASY